MTTPFSISEAPLIQIMPLPKGASLAGVTRADDIVSRPLRIDAWIQGHWRHLTAKSYGDRDDFYENHCHGCEYYFEYVYLNDTDIDYEVEYNGHETQILGRSTVRVASPCPCYREGLDAVDWPCLVGEDFAANEGGGSRDLAFTDVRFSVHLDATSLKRSSQLDHSPWCVLLQGYDSDSETGPYVFTATERVLNVYEPHGEVCWGHHTTIPRTLAEAAEAYAAIPCNEDLLSIDGFEDNAASIEHGSYDKDYDGALFPLLAEREQALIYCRATPANRQAFLLLATAQSAQVIGDVAILPATWQQVAMPDGSTRSLWVGDPLPDGHCWLFEAASDTERDGVQLNGQILGQLQLAPPALVTP
jgi:hypothetical protein